MDPGPLRDVFTLALGVVTGVLSAAFGVGGAVISTPGIRLLGASAFIAVGTTLPSILPSAVTGTVRYGRERLVDWRVVAAAAPGGVLASVGGARLSHAVPGEGHWLMVLTAVLLGVSAYRMARHPGPPLSAARLPAVMLGPGLPAGIGVVAGGLSGLLGVGGGVVMVPAFGELLRMPVKIAVATSLALVGIFAVPGTIAHALQDGVDWRFAFWLAVGVIPGARLGAAAAVRASDRRLRLAVAGFLGAIAVLYGVGELAALAG